MNLRAAVVGYAIAMCAGCANSTPVWTLTSPSPASLSAEASTKSKVSSWPVPHPDRSFGKEDPRYPPRPDQCPSGYDIIYNGQNFLCASGTDRELPHYEGYPNDWVRGE